MKLARWGSLLAGAAYTWFFLSFTLDGLNSWFSTDDLMNLYHYWMRPWPDLTLALAAPSSTYYRPVGGLFYKAIHAAAGLTPLPFRIVQLLLMLANVYLLYKVSDVLSASRVAGFVTLLAGGLHASMIMLYFDFGMIYDVLAFFFYFSAFLWYVRIRVRDQLPGPWQTVGIVLLGFAAMKSKESAASVPFAFLIFEVVWFGAPRLSRIVEWIKGPGRLTLIMGYVVFVYLAGRFLSQDALMVSHPAYKPQLSLALFGSVSAAYLKQLLYREHEIRTWVLCLVWASMFVTGLITRRKVMIWSTPFVILATLPVGFIPTRAASAYNVPAAGYFIYFGALAAWLRDLGSIGPWKRITVHGLLSVAIVTGLAFWLMRLHARKFHYPLQAVHEIQYRNRAWREQFISELPRARPGARILVINDPVGESYDLTFLLSLAYDDRSISVERKKVPVEERRAVLEVERKNYDHVFEYEAGRFTLIQ